MVAWAPIIGAGISALGSLFGSKDDDDDEEKKVTTTTDYVAMARAAEKAGFNPLTVLRNGGSAGFTTTTHPALSNEGGGWGAAMQTIGSAIMSFDPRADERAELEQQLLKAQIGQINRSGGASQRLWSMDVPVATGSSISVSPARGGAGGGNGAIVMPTPTGSGASDRLATNPYDTNSGIGIDPNTPDAAAATNRYGEIGEIIFGVHAAMRDWEINRKPPPITDAWSEPYRKAVQQTLTGTTRGDPVRHWNLPANRGW